MLTKYLIFYIIGGINLVVWISLFFYLLPSFLNGDISFQLDSSYFMSNMTTSKIEINPFLFLFSFFIFSSLVFALKFYYRTNTILLYCISICHLLFSSGGVVGSISLSSKINYLKNNFVDEVSLGWFNILFIQYKRTPEETWTSICTYIQRHVKYLKLTEEDTITLYNYIRDTKPSMAETICYLNSLYAKRIEILEKAAAELAKVEIVPVQEGSVSLFTSFCEYINPYFTSEYYYVGTISAVLVGVSLGYSLYSFLTKKPSLEQKVVALEQKVVTLEQNVDSYTKDICDLYDASDKTNIQIVDLETKIKAVPINNSVSMTKDGLKLTNSLVFDGSLPKSDVPSNMDLPKSDVPSNMDLPKSDVPSDMDLLKSDLDVLKSNMALRKLDLDALKSDVTTDMRNLKSKLVVLKSNQDTLKSNQDLLQSNQNVFKSNMAFRKSELEALKSNLNVLQSDVTADVKVLKSNQDVLKSNQKDLHDENDSLWIGQNLLFEEAKRQDVNVLKLFSTLQLDPVSRTALEKFITNTLKE